MTWQLSVVLTLSVLNLILLVFVFVLGRRMYIARGLVSSDESLLAFSRRIVRDMWEERRERREGWP